ncbi:MAG: hypothetical protein ACYDHD_02160 [Vulcanimicrobiaceae bacterium]
MLRRVEGEREAGRYAPLPPNAAQAVAPIAPDDELESPPLPRDLPPLVRDALAVSYRAKAFAARLQPIIVRVLTFWDHRVLGIVVGTQRVTVDISGSYRATSAR